MGNSLRILLVLGLLACPFQCMGALACHGGKEVASAPQSRCQCCPHEDDQPEVPGLPLSGDDCCDCICDGAVLSCQESVGMDVASAVLFARTCDAAEIVGSPFFGLSQLRTKFTSALLPGRALRLALHSLQV